MSTIEAISEAAIKNGGWASVQLGTFGFYALVADATELSYVNKTHLEKDNIIVNLSKKLLGDGLVFAPVPIWRPRRKTLAPTFSQHNLNGFVDVFSKQSSIMVDNLRLVADGGAFSIWNYITSYSMDSLSETTLGTIIGAQKTSDHKFLRSFKQFAKITSIRLFNPWLHNETSFKIFCYFGLYQKFVQCMECMKEVVFHIIYNKQAEMKEGSKKVVANGTNGKQKVTPILELLIQGEQRLSTLYLEEETRVLLVAGTDTSAVGAAFLMLMLAKYPDIQDKVYEEAIKVCGNSDRPIKPDDLSHLCYLEVVIKETLRLYPPVPITARRISEDSVTPAGVKLPAGFGVVIGHWAIHRNPKYWGEDVLEFRPERFFDSPPTHPGAFVPFSTGPRNCIGYKYAMMSMKTLVVTLLRSYRILPTEELKKPLRLTYDVMLKHADNFELKLETRK